MENTNQNQDITSTTPAPEEPAERIYLFTRKRSEDPDDVEQLEVPESELTHEQTQILAEDLYAYYESMPEAVQDIFMAGLASVMSEMMKQMEDAKKMRIVDMAGDPIQPSGESQIILMP